MKYKAFISYRHSELSRAHALGLEAALKRYAKPLFQPPMRVFRDEQILTPGDDLPKTLRAALEASEWLLLLAEKASAASPWVAEELRIWCRDLGRTERLVIIHVADEIGVDAAAQRIDWAATDALPAELQHHLPALPIYADFTWATRDEERDLGNSRYRSLINGLVARLRGVTPESMMGTEVLTHRRNVRLRNGGITAIVISAIAALLFGVLAVQRQREAEDRSAFSRSQRLAAQSTVELQSGRLDLALLLAVEAFRPLEAMRERGPEDAFDATSALFQATYANPRLWTYLLREDGLERLGFSRDGRLLTLVGGDRIHLWDAASLAPRPALVAGPDERDRPIAGMQSLMAFLVQGRVVVADDNGQEILKVFTTGQKGALDGPALSPSGATIAVGAGDQSVFLWDMSTPRSTASILRGHTSNVVSLAFSPDGATLATGSWDGTVRLWDARSGEARGVLSSGHRSQVEDLGFSADGEMLAVASGSSVFLWNPGTREQIGSPLAHDGKVSSLSIHPDGTLIAAAGPDLSRVLLWRLPSAAGTARRLEGHASGLKQVAFSPDGASLVGLSHNGTVIVWRGVERALPGEAFAAQFDEPRTLAFGPDGEIAVADCGARPERGRCEGGRVWRLRREAGPDGQGSRFVRSGEPLRGHPGAIEALAYSADGTELVTASCASYASATCSGALVLRWAHNGSAPAGEQRLGTDLELGRMAFDPGGNVFVGVVTDRRGPAWSGAAMDYEVWRWDVRRGAPIGEPSAGGDRLLIDLVFAAVAPRLLATGSFDETRIWRLDTGEQLLEVEGGKPVFDAGGRSVVTIRKGVFEQNRILVHDVATGAVTQEIVTPATETVVSSALSPDGRLLALGDAEGRVSLWHLGLSRMLGPPLQLHAKGAWQLAFADEGRVLYSIGDDGRVVALELDPARSMTRACRTVRRNLSHAEWVQFFGDEAYRLSCPDMPVHPGLLDSGRRLAAAGHVDGGSALMARAAALGDARVRDAAEEARTLAIRGFVDRAEQAARTGRVELAAGLFERARVLDPALDFEPATRAATIAAPLQVERADRLARLLRTDEALAAIDRALALDGQVAVSADTWYRLCRAGIVGGVAARVVQACDRAVERAEGKQNYFAARAAAHAMRGDAAAAVADLEAYLAYEAQPMRFRGDRRDPPEVVERVQGRLDAFRAGALQLSAEDITSFAAERR